VCVCVCVCVCLNLLSPSIRLYATSHMTFWKLPCFCCKYLPWRHVPGSGSRSSVRLSYMYKYSCMSSGGLPLAAFFLS
jgi:hypothetical protein